MLRGYADALCEMPTPGLVERTVIALECLTRSIAKTRLSLKWQLRCNRIFTKLRWLYVVSPVLKTTLIKPHLV